MTAYEFAQIMITHDGSQIWEHGIDIANMLIKQADRIKEMEQECAAMREQLKYLESQVYGGVTK